MRHSIHLFSHDKIWRYRSMHPLCCCQTPVNATRQNILNPNIVNLIGLTGEFIRIRSQSILNVFESYNSKHSLLDKKKTLWRGFLNFWSQKLYQYCSITRSYKILKKLTRYWVIVTQYYHLFSRIKTLYTRGNPKIKVVKSSSSLIVLPLCGAHSYYLL